MWESEKKLLHLKYRSLEDTQTNGLDSIEKQHMIKEKEMLTSIASVSDIIKLLETTKYHYLQYRIVFLEKIKIVYPKLHDYLRDVLTMIVSKIDNAILVWQQNGGVEEFLENV